MTLYYQTNTCGTLCAIAACRRLHALHSPRAAHTTDEMRRSLPTRTSCMLRMLRVPRRPHTHARNAVLHQGCGSPVRRTRPTRRQSQGNSGPSSETTSYSLWMDGPLKARSSPSCWFGRGVDQGFSARARDAPRRARLGDWVMILIFIYPYDILMLTCNTNVVV